MSIDAKVKLPLHDRNILVCRSAYLNDKQIDTVADLNHWSVSRVDSADEMLERIQDCHYDIIIVGISESPELMLGALTQVIRKSPEAVRIAVTGDLSSAFAARVSEVAHSSLPESCTDVQLSLAIEQALKVTGLIKKPEIKAFIGRIERLPSLPDIYEALSNALLSGQSSAREISQIIERDPVMSAKVLQLVNSAFFGLERQIYRLNEAVTILGVRSIRDLTLASHIFEAFPQSNAWASFSFSQIHSRSMLVARLAQDICRSVKVDKHVQGQAFLAGLLHDFGMVMLASHDPEKYRHIMNKAAELSQPLYVVEKMNLGVSHAEIGAYLLGLWNLPPKVVEAVLFHHFPGSSPSNKFQPLTAVHIADALLPSVNSINGCAISSQLSFKYIERLGFKDHLSQWEIMASKYAVKMSD
ncbi:response regulator [Neptunomonas antarctica]|uniref:HDIG domain-containing protein n=1 Tax=Neptunomonas antarctica TaxID=619304 RepID=A0A1N7M7W0_9GAMM|nr:response regulator [Neptunomonas antarctica]SIS82170.1 HDIG domain-containing protein [Neptunomonas antarctica]